MTAKRLVSEERYFQAKTLYQEAGICFLRSIIIRSNPYDTHGAIEALQHCFELSMKSLWLSVGLSYPNIHDAGRNLEKITQRMKKILPNLDYNLWSDIEKWIQEKSEYMDELHNTSIYGKDGIFASQLFTNEEYSTLMKAVSAFYAFIGGPILWIGNELNLLTDEEKIEFNKFIEKGRATIVNENKILRLQQQFKKFLEL